jgi:DNA-binding NtrC family response regulator
MRIANSSRTSTVPFFDCQKPFLHAISDTSPSFPVKRTVKPKRVLVVDDEIYVADSLTEILANHGYDAFACYNGHAAIESVQEQCPDFVISDVVMPKLNGVDTVLAIQKICPVARIILFSGQAGTANILEQARAKGHIFELLPKPIHPEQLLKRLTA